MQTPSRVGPDFAARYPDGSASATECAMNLVRTGDLVVSRVAAALKPLHITPAGGLVVGILKDAGVPCTPNQISQRLIVSRATVTGLLDTLERRGLVTRKQHPGDRRMVLVELTEAGSEMAVLVRRTIHRAEAEWLSSISEPERARLTELLGKVQASLAG